MKAEGVDGSRTKRTGGVAKVSRDGGKEKMALKEESEDWVVKTVGFSRPRKTW